MELITLTVEGMHCSMCESHVCDCIRKGLPQAKKVSASHMKGTATFVVEDGVDFTPAIDRIKKDGYQVLGQNRAPYEKKGFFASLFKK